MGAWVRWTVLGVSVFTACGGTSVRRSGGDHEAGAPNGGTSGASGAAGVVGSGGTTSGDDDDIISVGGASISTGGRGGTATGGRGGSAGRGGVAGSVGGDANGGIAGEFGGSGGELGCNPGPLYNECSFEQTCSEFRCGAPYSLYDAEGCARVQCTDTGLCPTGQRCSPSVVLGRFDRCFHGPDSCVVMIDNACECSYWEECGPLALCVPAGTPDCPVEGLDCGELVIAHDSLTNYRDGVEFIDVYVAPGDLAERVNDCLAQVDDRFEANCP